MNKKRGISNPKLKNKSHNFGLKSNSYVYKKIVMKNHNGEPLTIKDMFTGDSFYTLK